MKKGFTLIELLIVMVIVGILVTVALPKYQASMERGRGLEGINNLRALSDAANARYVMDGNTYVSSNLVSGGKLLVGDLTKSVLFNTPTLQTSSSTLAVFTTARSTGDYRLYAVNRNGELEYISCSGDRQSCLNIGMEEGTFTDSYSGGNLMMTF